MLHSQLQMFKSHLKKAFYKIFFLLFVTYEMILRDGMSELENPLKADFSNVLGIIDSKTKKLI